MSTLRFEIQEDTAQPALRALRAGITDRAKLNCAAVIDFDILCSRTGAGTAPATGGG